MKRPPLMHWTCRKCRAKWSTRLLSIPGEHREDAEATTICDECLNAMADRIRKRVAEPVPVRHL